MILWLPDLEPFDVQLEFNNIHVAGRGLFGGAWPDKDIWWGVQPVHEENAKIYSTLLEQLEDILTFEVNDVYVTCIFL